MTPQNELGKLVGELLGKSAGTSYWDNPFQVASYSFLKIRNDKSQSKFMLKVCWDDVELCKENLKTTYPPKLLELLFQCQLRFLAVYNVSRKLNSTFPVSIVIFKCPHFIISI